MQDKIRKNKRIKVEGFKGLHNKKLNRSNDDLKKKEEKPVFDRLYISGMDLKKKLDEKAVNQSHYVQNAQLNISKTEKHIKDSPNKH